MVANLYFTANGASPTTAALAKVSTGTSIMTMLQIQNSSARPLKLVEWGCSFDGTTAGIPIECELLETGSVGATSMNAGFTSAYDDPNAPASTVTAATYWKSGQAEGSVTAVRLFDLQLIAPTNQYVKQWPLGREAQVAVSRYLRIRFTAPAAVSAFAYILWEE